MRRWELAEDALISLLPRSKRGSSLFGRMGDVVQQPPVWAGLAAVLAATGGPRGRRAAWRGSACYAATAVVVNQVIKPVVGRKRPPGAGKDRTGPVTSSFPSGHAATDLAFTLGASQEIPALFLVLAPATTAAHWSLVRSRGHYPTDVLVGGAVGVAVALLAWKLVPPGGPTADEQEDEDPGVRPVP